GAEPRDRHRSARWRRRGARRIAPHRRARSTGAVSFLSGGDGRARAPSWQRSRGARTLSGGTRARAERDRAPLPREAPRVLRRRVAIPRVSIIQRLAQQAERIVLVLPRERFAHG